MPQKPDDHILQPASIVQDQWLSSTTIPVWFEGIDDKPTPALVLQTTLVDRGPKTSEGQIIKAVMVPWLEMAKEIGRDPRALFEFVGDPRKFEEFIAGAYVHAGFSKVELTPYSGDGGRDVIATMSGTVTIRVLDQVKAYKPGHKVTADDVSAMAGVLTTDMNTSKGIVTTTSEFAPGVYKRFENLMPYRLELRNGHDLSEWLRQMMGEGKE